MSNTPLLQPRKRTNKIPHYADSLQSYDSTALNTPKTPTTVIRTPVPHKHAKSHKLDTLNGVTLPTILNVLSILMFLRFGFIIGQMGVLGTLLLLVISYGIDLLTTLSISAIATNGIVKGGGAYYMLSRSLGVEFGGAIGVIFYIGQILNSSMNVAGLLEPLMFNFSVNDGNLMQALPESYWWNFTYCTVILFMCIVVSLIGSNAVSKCGKYLCMILIASTISIPISTLFVKPFTTRYGLEYTGPSWKILKENLLPHFTTGAAGSEIEGTETFNDLFGIFFPATAGILAGASMSGDLKNPSKSIPNGTLNGLAITFTFYFIVIVSVGFSVPRDLLYKDVQILQTINISPFIILAGELSTSLFSIIVGIVGAAKVLEAIALDEIIPGLKMFSHKDSKSCIIVTWILAQLFLFAPLNRIATFITMAFLMTFIVTNLACALLKLGSAPNFRPSFKYFNTNSALSGTIGCFIAMFVVDGLSATTMIIVLATLIILIHFTSQPKLWGDVSQSLIYHQVRKYLLKLRQDNVKYWRPQILLLVDDPRSCWNLILFCNHLKKGGLYILGHVIMVEDFQEEIRNINKSRDNWLKIRELSKVKAFVQVSVSSQFAWGVRNIYMGSGLGSMRPNITMIGFYDLARYKGKHNFPKCIDIESERAEFQNQVRVGLDSLPTDEDLKRKKKKGLQIGICEWIEIIEDLNSLNSNIGIGKGFSRLQMNECDVEDEKDREIRYIDLYPIDMISGDGEGDVVYEEGEDGVKRNNNFDTCTLILQMAAILHTVPRWKKRYRVRIIMIVEEEWEVSEERKKVEKLLEILRMQESEIVVVCLRTIKSRFYDYFVLGNKKVLSVYDLAMLEELNVTEKNCWIGRIGSGGNGKYSGDRIVSNTNVRFNSEAKEVKAGGSIAQSKAKTSGQSGVPLAKLNRRMTMSRIAELGVEEGEEDGDEDNYDYDDEDDDDDKDDHEEEEGEGDEGDEAEEEAAAEAAAEGANDNEELITGDSSVYGSDDSDNDGDANANANANVKRKPNAEGSGGNRGAACPFNLASRGSTSSMTRVQQLQHNPFFGFGMLRKRARCIVMSEISGKLSGKRGIVFAPLTVPRRGLHKDEDACVEWAIDVGVWTREVGACVLLHAKNVTVTGAL